MHWCDFPTYYEGLEARVPGWPKNSVFEHWKAKQVPKPKRTGKSKMGCLYYIEEVLTAFAKWRTETCSGNECNILQEDGAGAHKGKTTKRYWASKQGAKCLNGYVVNVKWPANSPDMNPVENMWTKMKNIKNRSKTPVRTAADIKEVIEAWVKDEKGECHALARKLHSSFEKRMNMVIASQGRRIPY